MARHNEVIETTGLIADEGHAWNWLVNSFSFVDRVTNGINRRL